jgi:hypothetical protein
VSPHLSISHGFPAAALTDVPQARTAVRIDALTAAVVEQTDVAPVLVEAAAYTYYVPSSVAVLA